MRRRHAFFDGRWHDEWLGEILRDDWKVAGPAGRDHRALDSPRVTRYLRRHR